ncbi:unnamed protein product [Prorocentrum cordatum]|uniref:3'-5' exonuclease domain-containing protein n=1 Tax=Prorocentrum cordatum TaxID=2364126 RepID=A0ABN9WGS7_9DINO|nr:unnamed protein product [Polarella glacialis]
MKDRSFDLLQAQRRCGGAGLRALVRASLGRDLDKSQQCSDWSLRPLSEAQRHYAALDAHALLQLFASCACEGAVLEAPAELLPEAEGVRESLGALRDMTAMGQVVGPQLQPLGTDLAGVRGQAKAMDEKFEAQIAEFKLKHASMKAELDQARKIYWTGARGTPTPGTSTPSLDDGRPDPSIPTLVTVAELEAKMIAMDNALKYSLASSRTPSSRTTSSDPWSSFVGQPKTKNNRGWEVVPGVALAGPPSPRGGDGGVNDMCKMWVRGFPRKLLSRAPQLQFELLRAAVPGFLVGACAQRQSYKLCYNAKFEHKEIHDFARPAPGDEMGVGREAFTLTRLEDAKSIGPPTELANAFPELIRGKLRSKRAGRERGTVKRKRSVVRRKQISCAGT